MITIKLSEDGGEINISKQYRDDFNLSELLDELLEKYKICKQSINLSKIDRQKIIAEFNNILIEFSPNLVAPINQYVVFCLKIDFQKSKNEDLIKMYIEHRLLKNSVVYFSFHPMPRNINDFIKEIQ